MCISVVIQAEEGTDTRKSSPELPALGERHIDAQKQIDHSVNRGWGKEVFDAAEQPVGDKAGKDAGQPAVVLQAEGEGDEQEGKEGEAHQGKGPKMGVDPKAHGLVAPEELLHDRHHKGRSEKPDHDGRSCRNRAAVDGIGIESCG